MNVRLSNKDAGYVYIDNKKTRIKDVKQRTADFIELTQGRGAIVLHTDQRARHNTVVTVRTGLSDAYDKVRNDYSKKNFRRSYNLLSIHQRNEVNRMFPVRITIVDAESANHRVDRPYRAYSP